jgi:hypothetical protein
MVNKDEQIIALQKKMKRTGIITSFVSILIGLTLTGLFPPESHGYVEIFDYKGLNWYFLAIGLTIDIWQSYRWLCLCKQLSALGKNNEA